MDNFVDYYSILEVPSTATAEQIRTAYKKAALKSHPDRVPSDSPERPVRTKKFQKINDAYFTLSDPTRRRDYDATWEFHTGTSSSSFAEEEADEEIPNAKPKPAAGGGFPWSAFGFGSGGGDAKTDTQEEKFGNEQFSSVFEEMMRDANLAEEDEHDGQKQTKPTGRFWQLIGAASGGALGFIVANLGGAAAGAVAGGKLGSIRDAKGKSVYAVYQELPQSDKAKLLTELASRLFATAISG